MNTSKPMKLFISHSSKDVSYVSYLVKYLESLGMNDSNMFCSSIKGYGIPVGANIFDYLKDQFQQYCLKVIFVLSDNYYKSVASLNEMGAAWVLQYTYNCILLPKFEFKDIKGAIDPRTISIKMDGSERDVKSGFTELALSLQSEFGLRAVNSDVLERNRDEFIRSVRSISSLWDEIHRFEIMKKPKKDWLIPLQRLEVYDPECFDVLISLSIAHWESGDNGSAKLYLQKAETVASDEEMRNDIRNFRIATGL